MLYTLWKEYFSKKMERIGGGHSQDERGKLGGCGCDREGGGGT